MTFQDKHLSYVSAAFVVQLLNYQHCELVRQVGSYRSNSNSGFGHFLETLLKLSQEFQLTSGAVWYQMKKEEVLSEKKLQTKDSVPTKLKPKKYFYSF